MVKRNIKIKLILLAVFTCLVVKSQTEYFVKLDAATGAITKIDSIPKVKFVEAHYAVYDQNNHHYIFVGGDSGTFLMPLGFKLYTLDALTGSVLYSPSFRRDSTSFGNIKTMEYSNYDNTLYAITTSSTSTSDVSLLITINQTNSNLTLIDTLHGLTNIGQSTFDDINNNFIVSATDTSGTPKLFTIDVNNANIISNPDIPVYDSLSGCYYANIKFSNKLNKLFGLIPCIQNNGYNSDLLVTIDKQTGNIITTDTLIRDLNATSGAVTLDDKNSRLIYMGFNFSLYNYLTTLNLTNQSIENIITYPLTYTIDSIYYNGTYWSGLTPIGCGPYYCLGSNLHTLRVDSTTGDIYALLWDEYNTVGIKEVKNKTEISIYPNPANNLLYIKTENDSKYTYEIINPTGQIVLSGSESNNGAISLSPLPTGIYFVKITSGNQITAHKLVIHK